MWRPCGRTLNGGTLGSEYRGWRGSPSSELLGEEEREREESKPEEKKKRAEKRGKEGTFIRVV